MQKITKIIFVLTLLILNIAIPFTLWANYKPYYLYQFDKYKVYELFEIYGTPKETSIEKFDELFDYLQFRRPTLDDRFFGEEDIIHMEDVKKLFLELYILIGICFSLLVFILIKSKLNFKKQIRIAGFLTLVLLLILIVTQAVLGFSGIFVKFHELFFENDYWLLDIETSNLIKFFPEGLFQILVNYIGSSIIIVSLLELGLSYKAEIKKILVKFVSTILRIIKDITKAYG